MSMLVGAVRACYYELLLTRLHSVCHHSHHSHHFSLSYQLYIEEKVSGEDGKTTYVAAREIHADLSLSTQW